jgi:hypothetical protein
MNSKLALIALTLAVSATSVQAATYWDPKDSSDNLKSTETWSSSTTSNKNWSSSSAGDTNANLVASSNVTVFSAADYNLSNYSVTVSGSVTNSSVTFQSGSVTFNGVSSAIIRVSSGGLILSNTLTGPVTLNSTVQVNGVNQAMAMTNTSSHSIIFNGLLTTTSTVGTPGTAVTIGGTGTGGFTFSGNIADGLSGGTTVLPFAFKINSATNTAFFDGAKTFTGGVTIQNGTAQINNAASLGDEATAVTFNGASPTLKLAADVLTSRPITMTTTGAIDTGGFNLTYSGAATGAGLITKKGDGAMLVNGTIEGRVDVTAGSLGGAGGTIGDAVTIQANGTLAPGASIGTLNFGNSLSLAGDSLFEINPDDLSTDHAAGVTFLTYGGTLHVNNLGDVNNFATGQTFDLFDSTGVAAGGFFSSIALPTLPTGLEWKTFSGAGQNDQTFDYSTGQIVIESASPIPEPATLGIVALGAAALLTRRRKA